MRIRPLAAAIALLCGPVAAEPSGAPMAAALGVELQKPAGDNVNFAHGSGVFLGGGLILTAAHVVKINPQDPDVSVIMDGWKTAAKVAAIAPNGLDLALLKIDPAEVSAQRKALGAVHLCAAPSVANQPVIVVAQGTVSLSKTIAAPIQTPALTGDWTDILATGYGHGASGGGVFDAGTGCLIGIIIIEATAPGIALTEFLPAAKIAPFLAASLH
jgi:hypothetical protein